MGIPSIALMAENHTTEPNGVEVKFAVNDRWDFNKFVDEARTVYKYFKCRPVIHGCKTFTFANPNYRDTDIIPGVHSVGDRTSSIAVMGNIAYPIDIPNAETVLGNLQQLLNCGLVMEFNIGELDFQASREGLSYIPSTINAIKNKLETLNNQLAVKIANDANKIANLWERSHFLQEKFIQNLWTAAITKYAIDTKFVFFDNTNASYPHFVPLTIKCSDLESKYNIKIRAFNISKNTTKTPNVKVSNLYDKNTKTYEEVWSISSTKTQYFVVTDTRRGSFERAKNHWRVHSNTQSYQFNIVYVIEPFDKTKAMNVDTFMKDIYNPVQVVKASTLLEKSKVKNKHGKASILKLEHRESRHNDKVVWVKAGTLSDYDDSETYYYIQMNHWTPVGVPYADLCSFVSDLNRSEIYTGEIYGVRKNDIDTVRDKPNWVELNGYLKDKLSKLDTSNIMGLVKEAIDFKSFFRYVNKDLNINSPYYKIYAEFKDVKDDESFKRTFIESLLRRYDIKINKIDSTKLVEEYKEKVVKLKERYPLIKSISYYNVNVCDVVSYINMVDSTKGI